MVRKKPRNGHETPARTADWRVRASVPLGTKAYSLRPAAFHRMTAMFPPSRLQIRANPETATDKLGHRQQTELAWLCQRSLQS